MFWNKPAPAPPKPAPFFSWTPDLRIGIPSFDLEHQEMGALVNQLHTLMVVRRDRVAADQLTGILIQTTRTHFSHEETLLTESGYAECQSHFDEHSRLIDELRDLQRQFKAGTLSALAMPVFLKKWLLDHIRNTDRLYVEHLKARGIR